MEIREYTKILWKRKLLILLCMVLLGGGCALLNKLVLKPIYRASTRVFLGGESVDVDAQAKLVKTHAVKQRVQAHFRSSLPRSNRKGYAWDISRVPLLKSMEPAQEVDVFTNAERRFVTISYESYDPIACAVIANAFADAYWQEFIEALAPETRALLNSNETTVREAGVLAQKLKRLKGSSGDYTALMQVADDLKQMAAVQQMYIIQQHAPDAVYITMIQPALIPVDPVRPQEERNIAIFCIVGLLMGVGISFFMESRELTNSEADSGEQNKNEPEHTWVAKMVVSYVQQKGEEYTLWLSMVLDLPSALWKRKFLVLGFVAVFGLLGYWLKSSGSLDMYEAQIVLDFASTDGEPVDGDALDFLLKSHETGIRAARHLLKEQAERNDLQSQETRERITQQDVIHTGLDLVSRPWVHDAGKSGRIQILYRSEDPGRAYDYARAYHKGVLELVNSY